MRPTFKPLAIVAGLAASAAVQANLIANGGFETPVVVGTYEHRNATELPGWTLFSSYKGTVQFNTLYDPVSEGIQAVQIEVPGDWISQTFPTAIGTTYTLSFDLAAYSVYGGPGLGYQPCPCVSVLGVTVGSLSEVVSGNSGGYITHSVIFVADTSLTTLRFENLGVPTVWGNYPQVDNVSVTRTFNVPEPSTSGLTVLGLAYLRWLRRKPRHGFA
jgi:hypothetical protein